DATFFLHPPDLIVALAAPATHFVQIHRAALFRKTPALLAAVDMRNVQVKMLTRNDAVVGLSFSPRRIVENILTVRPDTTNIYVIIGRDPLGAFWTNELQRDLRDLQGRVTVTALNDLSFAGILERCAVLPPHSAIIYQGIAVDANGIPLNEERAL